MFVKFDCPFHTVVITNNKRITKILMVSGNALTTTETNTCESVKVICTNTIKIDVFLQVLQDIENNTPMQKLRKKYSFKKDSPLDLLLDKNYEKIRQGIRERSVFLQNSIRRKEGEIQQNCMKTVQSINALFQANGGIADFEVLENVTDTLRLNIVVYNGMYRQLMAVSGFDYSDLKDFESCVTVTDPCVSLP